MWLLLGYLLLPCLAVGIKTRYDGDMVLRITPSNEKQLHLLNTLLQFEDYDVWKAPSAVNGPVDLHVTVKQQKHVLNLLTKHRFNYYIMIDDLQQAIQREAESLGEEKMSIDHTSYHTFDEIQAWLEEVAQDCADCETFNMGSSFEGRDLKGIKISRPGTSRSVWIDATIHAREWIAPAVANFLIDKLISDYGSDEDTTRIRDEFDFYILPVLNPDGYDYTWTSDRMWRKTRKSVEGSGCLGTDANRNYDYQWDLGLGTSDNPCSTTFRGPTAFSEPELVAQNAFIEPIKEQFSFYMAIHSYGQMLLYPWGYTRDPIEDFDDLADVGTIGVEAMGATHGMEYTYRQTGSEVSGMSIDWAYGAANIKYSYLLESRDTGQYGFVLPPQFIIPTGEETLAGVQAMLLRILEKDN